MGFGRRKQPVLTVSTLEGVLKYIESKKPLAAPVVGCSRHAWREHLDYFAYTGNKTDQLAKVPPNLYPVLAAYVAGEPVGYKGTVYKEDDPCTLAFCDPAPLYSIPPQGPVKSKRVRWKRVWATSDVALHEGEPCPASDSVQNDPDYLGTLVVRDYYEDGALVEQCTQFLPKY